MRNAFHGRSCDRRIRDFKGGTFEPIFFADPNRRVQRTTACSVTVFPNNPTDVRLWLGFLPVAASNPVFASNTPVYLGDDRYQLTLAGTTDSSNEIQASIDFENWDFIRDVAVTGSSATFLYTNRTVMPYLFFRARLLP